MDTGNDTQNLTRCPPGSSILFLATVTSLFSGVVLLGFLGNLLVIIVIFANNHMRNTTNILITSLALADLLFIIFCVPLTALFYIVGSWEFGHAACVIFQYFTFVPVYASVYTLVLMSADRYLAVVHPIRSIGLRNQRNTLLAVAITWLLIGVGHVPYAAQVGLVPVLHCLHGNDKNDQQLLTVLTCANRRFYFSDFRITTEGRIFYSAFGSVGYLLPFLVIICLYALLVRKLIHGRSAGVSRSSEAARSKRRVTRMIVTVVAIFGSCWLPIHVVFFLQAWHKDIEDSWFRYVQAGSQILAYTNSCVNPIVYAFLSENFRQAFAKFLGIQLAERRRCGGGRGGGGGGRPLETRALQTFDVGGMSCAPPPRIDRTCAGVHNNNVTNNNGAAEMAAAMEMKPLGATTAQVHRQDSGAAEEAAGRGEHIQ